MNFKVKTISITIIMLTWSVFCWLPPVLAIETPPLKHVIVSSVSPEFPNGLHYKYLVYIADALHSELDIVALPFARRVIELKNGKLDMMVGLQENRPEKSDLAYVYPSYESLKQTIYTRQDHVNLIHDLASFERASFAVTINGLYFPESKLLTSKQRVEVSTLEQKILMLQHGRVTGFIHYASSTEPLLKSLGLNNDIKPAVFQPGSRQDYYVALSPHSWLLTRKLELQAVIEDAIKKGQFQQIRQDHYRQQNANLSKFSQ